MNPRFPPVTAAGDSLAVATGTALAALDAPDTNVEIEPAQDYAIELVATFCPAAAAQFDSMRLVAGLQTVDSNVYVDFKRSLPLWWLGSVYRTGEVSPNSQVFAYTSHTDSFSMPITKDITLTHDSGGWKVPLYDATDYSVMVGFGLGVDLVFPAYLAEAPPATLLTVAAGGYQLARSAGAQTIGDVVASNQEAWSMPLGSAYLLTFDASGTGHLTKR
ncbi:hypothetical protein [Sphingomonas sp. JC676]|uniref:hypothetical protein n=1 Tax=Sphingomonas sp. JC676 TaxID=2768065 RepID=UPI00223BCA1E|nr:hypothetical protein [Sphingomonas sp. JC676]